MTYLEALDILDKTQNTERLRWLCSDANPDDQGRDGYRRLVIMIVDGTVPEYDPSQTLDGSGGFLGSCCG